MTTLERTSLSGREPIDITALGWALSITFVVLFILCALVAVVAPNAPLAHGWLALFSTAETGSLRSYVEGIIGSIVFGWLTAILVGLIYNRLAR
jgi:hypothetical protein